MKRGNPLARLIDGKMAALIVNKSQEKMLKAFEGIQQVRTASEARIKQNVENLNEIDEEPPEEIVIMKIFLYKSNTIKGLERNG